MHNARIHLLRHGETLAGSRFCGATDVALSAHGWMQMRTSTANETWDAIVSSPLRRCADFACALSEERSLPLTIDERLRELDFGEWENKTSAELWQTDNARLANFWSNPWLHNPPGGESLASLRQRVLAVWAEIEALGKRCLVITHGGPIRVVLSELQNIPADKFLNLDVPHAALHCVLYRSQSVA